MTDIENCIFCGGNHKSYIRCTHTEEIGGEYRKYTCKHCGGTGGAWEGNSANVTNSILARFCKDNCKFKQVYEKND